jgi:hypothetical protein
MKFKYPKTLHLPDSLGTTKDDKTILALKKEIETKKKLISKIDKFNPLTNCMLTLFGQSINLHTRTKEELLLLKAQLKSWRQQVSDEPLMLGSFIIDDYIEDISTKYNILNLSTEKTRLTNLEKQLHNLLSIDKKVELELENLKSQI